MKFSERYWLKRLSPLDSREGLGIVTALSGYWQATDLTPQQRLWLGAVHHSAAQAFLLLHPETLSATQVQARHNVLIEQVAGLSLRAHDDPAKAAALRLLTDEAALSAAPVTLEALEAWGLRPADLQPLLFLLPGQERWQDLLPAQRRWLDPLGMWTATFTVRVPGHTGHIALPYRVAEASGLTQGYPVSTDHRPAPFGAFPFSSDFAALLRQSGLRDLLSEFAFQA